MTALSPHSLPVSGTGNSFWYFRGAPGVVVVFIHGIFSDSRSCWMSENVVAEQRIYWPDLVRVDPRLGAPSIFMAGYYTSLDSGDFSLAQCAREVFDALRTPSLDGAPAVVDYPAVVFVCHSTGGIVARYLIERYKQIFVGKAVGLLLISSPSLGSVWANIASLAARYYNQQLGLQLRWGGEALADIHSRFKDLVDQRADLMPGLKGAEAVENKMIFRDSVPTFLLPFLPPRLKVVTTLSAGQYFGQPRVLPGTDHFSSVKPSGGDHPSHEFLVNFFVDFARSEAFRSSLPATTPPPQAPPPDWFRGAISRQDVGKHRGQSPWTRWAIVGFAAALFCGIAYTSWTLLSRAPCQDTFLQAKTAYLRMNTSEAGDLFSKAAACGHMLATGWVARGHNRGSLGLRLDTERAHELARQSLDAIRRSAEDGSADAQFVLGALYYDALGVPRDLAATRKWLSLAATQQNPTAQYSLAVMISQGDLSGDNTEVYELMTAASGNGLAEASRWLGSHADQLSDYGSSLAWYQLAVRQGDLAASVRVGRILEQGLGRPRDRCGACQSYEVAALANISAGQTNLGACFEEGVAACIVSGAVRYQVDPCAAKAWYAKAAAGNPPEVRALYNLGSLIYRGVCGGSQAEAVALLKRASDAGSVEAEALLTRVRR